MILSSIRIAQILEQVRPGCIKDRNVIGITTTLAHDSRMCFMLHREGDVRDTFMLTAEESERFMWLARHG